MTAEIISEDPKVVRLKVFKGWLVCTDAGDTSYIPDPNFEWVLTQPAPPNVPPQVTLSLKSVSGVAPGSATLLAAVADIDGFVTKVDFFDGATLLGSVTSAPWELPLTNLMDGNYHFSALALDDDGAVTPSTVVDLIVVKPNVAPTITLAASALDTITPGGLMLNAVASDSDGLVKEVRFYSGATLIKTATQPPYTVTVAGLTAGAFAFTAVAEDNQGLMKTSNAVSLTVADPVNLPPTISLASSNPDLITPGGITLTATANDDIAVANVKFYQNGVLLGMTTAAPHTLNVLALTANNYSFTATATDSQGLVTTSNAVPLVVADPVVVPPVVPAPAGQLGTNLIELTDWQDNPIANICKAARDWISTDGTAWSDTRALDLDANGYIKSLQVGQKARLLMFWDHKAGDHATGEYTFTYTGTGTFTFPFGATVIASSPGLIRLNVVDGGLCLLLNTVDPANYPKNFKIIRKANVSQVLDDAFLANTAHYSTFRFMDWQQTNKVTVASVASVPGPDKLSYANGVSPELIADVANAANKNVWVCMPHLASDAYIKSFAERLKAALLTHLKVYVAWSNECWNSVFPQAVYTQDQGLALGLSTDRYLAGALFAARKTAQTGAIFKAVFADNPARVVTVMEYMAVNSWFTDQMLKFESTASKIDMVAIAPYFGGNYDDNTAVATMTLPQLLAGLKTSITTSISWVTAHKTLMAAYPKLKLSFYECGQHLVTAGALMNNAAAEKLFNDANGDVEMGNLYKTYLDACKAAGTDLMCHFTHCSTWTKWGYWGSMKNRLDVSQAKLLALKAWAAANK